MHAPALVAQRHRRIAGLSIACGLGAVVFAVLHRSPASVHAGSGDEDPITGGLSHYESASGSCGIVDDADRGEIKFTGAVASFVASATKDTAVIRYPVNLGTTVEINYPLSQATLLALLKDNGGKARVVVKLRKTRLDTGANETLLTVDSDEFPRSSNFVLRAQQIDNPAFGFELSAAYWIEVTMTRTSASGTPELSSVQAVFQEP